MNDHAEPSDTRILTKNHAAVTIADMNARNRSEQEALLADELVAMINAAKEAKGLSSRDLGRALGWSSQYVSQRLDGGNPKTGKRVALTPYELILLSGLLELDAVELMRRLVASVNSVDDDELDRLAGSGD